MSNLNSLIQVAATLAQAQAQMTNALAQLIELSKNCTSVDPNQLQALQNIFIPSQPQATPEVRNEATSEVSQRRKSNRWIKHVKEYAKRNNMTYRDATKDPECKKQYYESTLILEVIEPSDMGKLMSLYPQTIVIPTESWRILRDTAAASAAAKNDNHLIPFNPSSAKSLLLAYRNYSTPTYNQYNISSRAHAITSLQLSIGGMSYPSSAITAKTDSIAEMGIELVKCFHGLGSSNAICGTINGTEFLSGTEGNPYTGAESYRNCALYGVDLKPFSNRSNVLISGTDLSGVNTFINSTLAAATGVSYELNMIMHFDMLLYISNGQLVSRV